MSCDDGGSASIWPLKLSPQNSRSTWSMMLTLTMPAAPSAPCEPESDAAGSRPGGENACGFAMVPVSIGGQSPTLRQVASSGGRCRETVDEAVSIRGSVQWCGGNEFLSAAHRNARMFLRDSVTLSSKGMGIFAQGGIASAAACAEDCRTRRALRNSPSAIPVSFYRKMQGKVDRRLDQI
jgi:hypothetical protein